MWVSDFMTNVAIISRELEFAERHYGTHLISVGRGFKGQKACFRGIRALREIVLLRLAIAE